MKRKHERRRLSLRQRVGRFVRTLFSSDPPDPWLEPPAGGVGVREPRRPLRPSSSRTAVLEAPPEEMRDVWAVGGEERG